MLTLLSAVVLLDAATSDPFFSNDAAGFVKVVLVFGSLMSVVVGVVVRLSQSQFRADIRDAKQDVTNLGAKVDGMAREIAGEKAQSEATRIDVARHASELGNLREGFGEIRAGLAAIHSQNTELQRDISSAITESGRAIEKRVGEIAIDVARLQERDRLAEAITTLSKTVRDTP